MDKTRYTKGQRERKNPPLVSLRDLRTVAGMTLDQVCERFKEATGDTLTKGALSAIETGLRGLSPETALGIAMAYGIPSDAIHTEYELSMAVPA